MVSDTAPAGAEQRLRDLNITLPPVPAPLGAYVEAVKSGNLLYLTGMLPIIGGKPLFFGQVGAELDLEAGRQATYAACLNALATAQKYLGSLDKVSRVVKLGVYVAATKDFKEHAKLADAASELIESVFGRAKTSTRVVLGVSSLPLGLAVELEFVFEVSE